ncbi:hypothetical protein PtA15_7A276 [Puccinia triticina]|uniref:Uncharacterized protein n=1 Tax=Puccinia triticina TaxID=208348 RepID=A0ABY7CPF3_9BASI|nr:uncharacterized protein PtA15_7A276 [Puccinia triticina]WAQ86550.1 hypothetical protein PtA15_7A276 [Puccinia triticina]
MHINGLRYHYQHTGPHGRTGLHLLSLGHHPSGPALNLSSLDGGSIDGLASTDSMDD